LRSSHQEQTVVIKGCHARHEFDRFAQAMSMIHQQVQRHDGQLREIHATAGGTSSAACAASALA
jgi:hypothetical protein